MTKILRKLKRSKSKKKISNQEKNLKFRKFTVNLLSRNKTNIFLYNN